MYAVNDMGKHFNPIFPLILVKHTQFTYYRLSSDLSAAVGLVVVDLGVRYAHAHAGAQRSPPSASKLCTLV